MVLLLQRRGPVVLAVGGLLAMLGCGMAAAPQPPSLNLPKPVADLSAQRIGNRVRLGWTTPTENTDKLKLRGPVQFRICRQEKAAACQSVATVSFPPGKPAEYTDVLSAALVTGPLRPIQYETFGINKHGRNAGPSNGASVLAGQAPPPVSGLSATLLEQGVVLHWQPAAGLPADTQVELKRTLLTPPAKTPPSKSHATGALPAPDVPIEQTLIVKLDAGKPDPGTSLDSSVAFGNTYRYAAARVTEQQFGKQILQAKSSSSAPVTIAVRDVFPPHAPVGLAAVPVSAAMNNGAPEVDLSWSANTEPDLAQYRIYRRDVTTGSAARQIAPQYLSAPIVTPTFRDLQVQSGHTYAYSVTALDEVGNESLYSKEAEVTVPTS